MIRYSKTSQHAITCLICLAELHGSNSPTLSSTEIASRTEISQPTVAKILSSLSIAQLVEGCHGPKGGYKLSRPPSRICLLQVIKLFERCDGLPCCYQGKEHTHNCVSPLHKSLLAINNSIEDLFEGTTLRKLIDSKSEVLKKQSLVHPSLL